MFYQVSFSPVKNKVQKQEREPHVEVSHLSLALFSRTPKLVFENIKLGTTAKQKLNVTNPSKRDVEIFISRASPEERCVTYSWKNCMVCAESEAVLEITWNPLETGAWRDVLTLEDGDKIRKDIPIAFKCVLLKKPLKARSNLKPAGAKTLDKKLKKKSPLKLRPKWKTSPVRKAKSPKSKRSPQTKRALLQSNSIVPEIIVTPETRRATYNVGEKENFLPIGVVQNDTHQSPCSSTYILESNKTLTSTSDSFDDSLEAVLPVFASNCIQEYEENFPNVNITPIMPTKIQHSACSTVEKSANKESTTDVLDLTGGTYVKGNVSGETYVKANTSSGTYVLDDSRGSLLMESPVNFNEKAKGRSLFHTETPNTPFTDVWNLTKRPLENIAEESVIQSSFVQRDAPSVSYRKRKSELTHVISASKRVALQPVDPWAPRTAGTAKKLKFSKGLTEFIQNTKVCGEESKNEESVNLHDPDAFLNEINNPYILATTNNIDPFMSATLYYEPRWIDEQEARFKNWINALITPPEELASNAECHPVDVARLWQECKKSEVSKVPTKEEMSSKLHVSSLLDTLRKNAIILFRSKDVSQVLSKCAMLVENAKLSIRADKDVHLDVGLQSELMKMLLSYNPLWLRIGLETTFGRTIPLSSNSDLMGLSSFIMSNFFKDPYLLAKYKTVHSHKYNVDIKKHILRKFLLLVYFLDRAKEKRLIQYDPCLFCKNASYKESRELILKFSSEFISSIGDITKCLRYTGYVLDHKQTYIYEYDYSVENLGTDLRDGVRLVRVMEVILLKDDLVKCLRVPAISRLQKIHNMKIVFESLAQANYNILNEITPKDIVDGHKEKTLSLLWQIIYKFQAPRFVKAVVLVQNWWRSLKVVVKRRVNERAHRKQHNAAVVIQKWFRRHKYRTALEQFVPLLRTYLHHLRRHKAASLIQATYRMHRQQVTYKQILTTVVTIQSYARKRLVIYQVELKINAITKLQASIRCYLQRKRFLILKHAVHCIEEKYLAMKLMKTEMERYHTYKSNVIFVQRKFRAKVLMKRCKADYVELKSASIFVQRTYRATKLMRLQRESYNRLREATLVIQTRLRATRLMKEQRFAYNRQKRAVLFVQQTFRARKLMKRHRDEYLQQRQAVITIQCKYRAFKAMQSQRNLFVELKEAAIVVQRRFRALKAMQLQKNTFKELKQAVIVVQRRFRALKAMRLQKNRFEEQKQAAIVVQRRFRALKAMRLQKNRFDKQKQAAIVAQRRFRALKAMRLQKNRFDKQKQAAIVVQRRFRALKAMRLQKKRFEEQKQAAIVVQRRFRALKAMRLQKNRFEEQKQAAIVVQRRFRALKVMRLQKNRFEEQKQAAIVVQRRFRALKAMRLQKNRFEEQKQAAIVVQRRFRALKAMRLQKNRFEEQKQAAIVVQRRFRALQAMRLQKNTFKELKQATIVIQRRFRALKAMRAQKSLYDEQRKAIVLIQRKFRAIKQMRAHKSAYQLLKQAALLIQRKYKAVGAMRKQRTHYLLQREAAVAIQRWYRATKAMQSQKILYESMKNAAVVIQRRFRATIEMQEVLFDYDLMRDAVLKVQRRFRANRAMKQQRAKFLAQRESAVLIQRRFRATKAMNELRWRYLQLRDAVVKIQILFRARAARLKYIAAVIFVQSLFRAKQQRNLYQEQRTAALIIQKYYRGSRIAREYGKLKSAVLYVQRRYRATKIMMVTREMYLKQRQSAITIQRRFRAYVLMKRERNRYLLLRRAIISVQTIFKAKMELRYSAAVKIQRYYRGYITMKNDVVVRKAKLEVVQTLQAYARGFLARARYKEMMDPEFVKQRKLEISATKIQAFWRGFSVRRRESSDFALIRKRYKIAEQNKNAESTLGHRKDAAYKVLVNVRSSFHQIIKALEDIEYVTRRCKDTCLSMSEPLSEGVAEIMVSTGRSLPDIKACLLATDIIINFYKYPASSRYAWLPRNLQGFVTVMLHWCDKECPVFPHLCTLIWLYTRVEHQLRTLQGLPNISQQVLKIRTLVERKQKMVMRSAFKGTSVFAVYTVLPLPAVTPDWGIEYKDRPRTFQNSVHAVRSLVQAMEIL